MLRRKIPKKIERVRASLVLIRRVVLFNHKNSWLGSEGFTMQWLTVVLNIQKKVLMSGWHARPYKKWHKLLRAESSDNDHVYWKWKETAISLSPSKSYNINTKRWGRTQINLCVCNYLFIRVFCASLSVRPCFCMSICVAACLSVCMCSCIWVLVSLFMCVSSDSKEGRVDQCLANSKDAAT